MAAMLVVEMAMVPASWWSQEMMLKGKRKRVGWGGMFLHRNHAAEVGRHCFELKFGFLFIFRQ